MTKTPAWPRRPLTEKGICVICSAPFFTRRGRTASKTCSWACRSLLIRRNVHAGKPRHVPGLCGACKQTFLMKPYKPRKFCSTKCAYAVRPGMLAGRINNPATKRKRTFHSRAQRMKMTVATCEFAHLGWCKGPLQVAHVDQNFRNNSPGNLLKLCVSHHRLMDNGSINSKTKEMPDFFISGGNRRYAHSYRSFFSKKRRGVKT